MPTTTRYAFRYPSTSDTPNGAAQIQALASDVEAALGTVDDSVGYVGETVRTTQITGVTTTETMLDTITFTASSARRYKVTALLNYQAGGIGNIIQVRMRWKAGSVLDAAGTEFSSTLCTTENANNDGVPITIVRTITGLSGTVTLGTTGVRTAGANTITFFASAAANAYLLVETIA